MLRGTKPSISGSAIKSMTTVLQLQAKSYSKMGHNYITFFLVITIGTNKFECLSFQPSLMFASKDGSLP